VGADYYSKRGWAQSATFRYRGLGNDFARAHYNGLLDRGYYSGTQYINQGGEDVTFAARHDFSEQTRVVADMEYLSSYTYREVFTENFNTAVSTDIVSYAYGVHEADGYAASLYADRYQGLKLAAMGNIPEQEVRIFHVPSLSLSTTEHNFGDTHLLWNLQSSFAGLKRVQPNFATSGITERFDLNPTIAYPFTLAKWSLRPSIGIRDTIYSRSRVTPYPPLSPPIESYNGINRADFEAQFDVRPPVIERTFNSPGVEKFFHNDIRHTIEPAFTYRYVTGVNNFLNILRFDDVDVVSDTNEVQYGVTQRLFLRPLKSKPCTPIDPLAIATVIDADPQTNYTTCSSREWISWRLTQKYFFDPNFGGAVINNRRNIFTTTLNLSGIAFLTEPRNISPLVSRLRIRTSDNTDLEWDFDLDTGAKKFTSNNVFADVHKGNAFAALSYARLNAPGRFYTQGVSSSVSNFSQLRILLGYGNPTKRGLGVAANVGLDLILDSVQYGALQSSYNWDCCGFSFEYRKYDLGSVRNENAYRFNFTLANIGTAGNLRRAERLF
jgi:LPS-assembly protein